MERVAGLDEMGIEQDLVRFAESKCHLIVGHDFPVFFASFGAHLVGWSVSGPRGFKRSRVGRVSTENPKRRTPKCLSGRGSGKERPDGYVFSKVDARRLFMEVSCDRTL